MGMQGLAGDDPRQDINCGSDGQTSQEFLVDSDINVIVARCLRTGTLPPLEAQPVFADVSEIGHFDDCVRRIDAARAAFLTLPAKLRSEFNNDATALVLFLQNPANRAKAVELGLIEKPVVVDPNLDPKAGQRAAAAAAAVGAGAGDPPGSAPAPAAVQPS